MRHLVRDVSRVLTLFLASRQAWPKIRGGSFDAWGEIPSPKKRSLDKSLPGDGKISRDSRRNVAKFGFCGATQATGSEYTSSCCLQTQQFIADVDCVYISKPISFDVFTLFTRAMLC